MMVGVIPSGNGVACTSARRSGLRCSAVGAGIVELAVEVFG